MNKKTVLLVLASMFVTACAATTGVSQGGGVIAPPGPNAAGCHVRKLKLHLDQYEMKLTPKGVKCVVTNVSFKMEINIPAYSRVDLKLNDVTVKEKDLTGTVQIRGINNVRKDEVIITVTGNAELNKEYGFDIKVKNVGTLDPVVKVVGKTAIREVGAADLAEYEASQLELFIDED